MKNKIEKLFSETFDKAGAYHNLSVESIVGSRGFNDEKSCGDCNRVLWRTNCDQVTFLLRTSTPVYFADIEDFLNSFQNLHSDRCDLMLYDERKIVFVDMYCGMSEYLYDHLRDGHKVTGKMAKVRSQIEATIALLYKFPELETILDMFEIKEGICAYRSKDEEVFKNVPKKISASMNMFLRLTKEQEDKNIATPLSHGFWFATNKYDKVYDWQ